MTTEAQKRASKKYYEKNKEVIAKQKKEYYQNNKRLILDNKIQDRLIEKIKKPYNLKCKGILYCNDIHLLRKKRETELNEIDDGQEHNFNELYKMIFKRDLNGKNRS